MPCELPLFAYGLLLNHGTDRFLRLAVIMLAPLKKSEAKLQRTLRRAIVSVVSLMEVRLYLRMTVIHTLVAQLLNPRNPRNPFYD
jgi:hypothetical protein